MNTVDITLSRDPSKDYSKDGVDYFGLDIHWKDGSPTSVNFQHFCKTGISRVFGKNVNIPKGKYDATFYFVPVADMKSLVSQIKNVGKVRRMFAVKEDGIVTFYFRRGIETIMKFTETDEDKVKQWMCYDKIGPHKFWFDFAATVKPKGWFTKARTIFHFFINRGNHGN